MTDCIRFDILQSWPDRPVLVLGVRPAQGKKSILVSLAGIRSFHFRRYGYLFADNNRIIRQLCGSFRLV
ncbi:hypothetical protein [Methylotuvimicrobium sp.]